MMSPVSWLLLLAAGSALVDSSLGSTVEERQQLHNTLLADYVKTVRPDGLSLDTPVVVNISYSLTSLSTDGLPKGYLDTVGYLSMTWVDKRLAFPKSSDVVSLRMDVSQIWTPDVELYNSVPPGMQHLLDNKGLAVVSSTGEVHWVPMVATRSRCEIGRYDSQTICRLKFGSWTYNGHEVDLGLNSNTVDLSEYTTSLRTRMNSTRAVRTEAYYTCCPEPYVSVSFYLDFHFQLANW